MKVKFIHSLVAVILMVFTAFIISCDKNSTDNGDNEENPQLDAQTQQNAEAAYYGTTYAGAMTVPASALSTVGSLSANLKTAGAMEDTVFTGCPTVVFYPFMKDIVLDWGDGCTGPAGITTSGSIRMHGSFENNVLVFSATFDNLSSEGYYINGNVDFIATDEYVEVTIQNGTIAENDTVYSISGKLKIEVINNGTPDDFYDDLYVVTGNLSVASNTEPPVVTDLSIRTDAPLKYRATCEYAYTGIIDFKTNDLGTGYADFSPINQACDAIVAFYAVDDQTGQQINLDEL